MLRKPTLMRQDLPEFEAWFREVLPQVHDAQELLADPFNDDPVRLREQMRACEAWHSRVNAMHAEAKSQLSIGRLRALEKVPAAVKDFERRIRVEQAVNVQQRVMDTLDGLARAIKDRLMLGENLNRHNNEERNRHHA